MKDECDINNILRKYIKTGNISHFSKHSGAYMDCPELDYRQALETLNTAQNMFNDLPGKTRQKFHNDPGEFLAFVQDEKNLDEMRSMGLAKSQPPSPTPPPEGDKKPPEGEGND